MPLKPITLELLALTDQPYDQFNVILPKIKKEISGFDLVGHQRVGVFEAALQEELPLTTARRAFRTAIKLALGEDEVIREFRPPVKFKQARKTNQEKWLTRFRS